MGLILNIETSTENCSVALGKNGAVISAKELASEEYIHSESLHSFIGELMQAASLKLSQLEAISVGKGPGSYTGLRIGVSAAKGLAFTLGIPLISIAGLNAMAHAFSGTGRASAGDLLMPMIDARRMEVYTGLYNHTATPVSLIEAKIIEANSLEHLEAEKVFIFGTGADKCASVLTSSKFVFEGPKYPSASHMVALSEEHFHKSKFEDVAYFEPFYLKEFQAGKPKRLL